MMEQENNPESAAAEKPLIGHLLRERRESMGLDIDDVVAKIKLSHGQVVALEENDFKALPEIVFLRGFVRSYARLLQMDERALLEHLPTVQVSEVKIEPDQFEAEFPTARSARRQSVNLLLAALLVVIVILGFVLWQSKVPHHANVKPSETTLTTTPLVLPKPEIDAASSVQAASSVPASQSAPLSVEPAASAVVPAVSVDHVAGTLRIVFDKECWAEIKDKYGRTLSRQVNSAGSELRLEGDAPFAVVIGHAQAVHLYYKDKPVNLDPYINSTSDVARLTLE